MGIEERRTLDTATLAALMEESEDLHVDAMQVARESLPELADLRSERKGEVDTDEIHTFNGARRDLLSRMGYGAGGLAARTLVGGSLGGLLSGLLATPARADIALDIQMLQTASSLEALAVATYTAALGEGPEGADAPAARALAGIPAERARATVAAFATETRRQHAEHKMAFQAQTTALGGKVQDAPNPRFLALAMAADLSTPARLVDFAATLEKVATDTYLVNLSMLQDQRSKGIVASVMAVESQHLATLRAVGALLATGPAGAALVAVPFPAGDIMKLPAMAGTVPFPDAFHKVSGPELVADPRSGAVT
ncbi:MAG: ferritin-like domain-containing protein [Acidimicrobiales bacterium]